MTTRWSSGPYRTEGDVVFTNGHSWNSYPGPLRVAADGTQYLEDITRVALHEFGHELGLDHPDDHGQHLAAIMNAKASDTDDLQPDDIAGVTALYGGSVTTTTVPAEPCGGRCSGNFPNCGPDGRCWDRPCATLCGGGCCGPSLPTCGPDQAHCYAPPTGGGSGIPRTICPQACALTIGGCQSACSGRPGRVKKCRARCRRLVLRSCRKGGTCTWP